MENRIIIFDFPFSISDRQSMTEIEGFILAGGASSRMIFFGGRMSFSGLTGNQITKNYKKYPTCPK